MTIFRSSWRNSSPPGTNTSSWTPAGTRATPSQNCLKSRGAGDVRSASSTNGAASFPRRPSFRTEFGHFPTPAMPQASSSASISCGGFRCRRSRRIRPSRAIPRPMRATSSIPITSATGATTSVPSTWTSTAHRPSTTARPSIFWTTSRSTSSSLMTPLPTCAKSTRWRGRSTAIRARWFSASRRAAPFRRSVGGITQNGRRWSASRVTFGTGPATTS